MYDIFYCSLSNINECRWKEFKTTYPSAQKVDRLKDFDQLKQKSFTKHFWIVWDDISLNKDFNLNEYRVTPWDEQYIHVFDNLGKYDGLALFPKYNRVSFKELKSRFYLNKKEIEITASSPIAYDKFIIDTYEDYLECLEKSFSEMFWIIPKEIEPLNDFKFSFYISHHDVYDRNINHVFENRFNDNTINYNGIMLLSKNKKLSKREIDYRFLIEKKEHRGVVSQNKKYDIIFISYNEPNADENFRNLQQRFPQAKRVHGIKGIHAAHIKAAELSETEMFWVVDGDSIIDENFNFDFLVTRYERDIVHVWRSRNPINDLEYGYGGIKLLPRDLTLNMKTDTTDMTTSISQRFKSMPTVSNTTAFNTDPFNTWKSAFRESVKLASKIIVNQNDEETENRLDIWCSDKGLDRPFGKYAIQGAICGKQFAIDNPDKLHFINDFDWLKQEFEKN